MSDIDFNEIEKLAEDFASRLAEHSDSVRIFVTKQGDGSASNSGYFSTGRGSLFAQIGQVKEWIITQDEYVKENARRNAFPNDEEES